MRRSLPGSLVIRAALRIAQGYTAPARREFMRAVDDPEAAQAAVLRRLAAAAARTDYGRQHGIAPDSDYAAWRERLPIVGWEDLEPWLAREREQPGALVADRIVEWGQSRGTSGSPKRVPYTSALKASFAHAVYIWAHDLLGTGTKLRTGYCYFEVDSPAVRPRGLGSDEGYVDGPLAVLLRPFLVVDPRIRALRTLDGFQLVLALSLVAAADLEVISIWDPDLFLAICDYIVAHRDRLAAVLAEQRLVSEDHAFRFAPLSADRGAALARGDLPALWPALKIVSTCAEDTAATGAAELARRLPHARHQGKGLLTTEAPLSIPITDANGALPIAHEVFYELEGDDGTLVRLHQAAIGREYALVISQAGGLLRYRIGDRVRVPKRWRGMPCFEYIGRA